MAVEGWYQRLQEESRQFMEENQRQWDERQRQWDERRLEQRQSINQKIDSKFEELMELLRSMNGNSAASTSAGSGVVGGGAPVRDESWEAPRSADSQENEESRSSGPGSWNRLDSGIEVNRTPRIENPIDESSQEISDLKESYLEMVNLEEGLEAENLNHQSAPLANLWTEKSQATSVDSFSGRTDPTIHWGINIAVEGISKPFMAVPPVAIKEQEFNEKVEELHPQFKQPEPEVNSHPVAVVVEYELEMDEWAGAWPQSVRIKWSDFHMISIESFGNSVQFVEVFSADQLFVEMSTTIFDPGGAFEVIDCGRGEGRATGMALPDHLGYNLMGSVVLLNVRFTQCYSNYIPFDRGKEVALSGCWDYPKSGCDSLDGEFRGISIEVLFDKLSCNSCTGVYEGAKNQSNGWVMVQNICSVVIRLEVYIEVVDDKLFIFDPGGNYELLVVLVIAHVYSYGPVGCSICKLGLAFGVGRKSSCSFILHRSEMLVTHDHGGSWGDQSGLAELDFF